MVNNFGSIISIGSIYDYLIKGEKIPVDRRTIKSYIEVLENAKIIYSCDLFDMKSKKVLDGEKKYYLADLSIYFALNTDNRINYGPVLENILFSYLKSKNYSLSVGKIGNLECVLLLDVVLMNIFISKLRKIWMIKKQKKENISHFMK